MEPLTRSWLIIVSLCTILHGHGILATIMAKTLQDLGKVSWYPLQSRVFRELSLERGWLLEFIWIVFWVFPQAPWCFLPSVFLLSLLDRESTFVPNPPTRPDNEVCKGGRIVSWIAELIESVICVFKSLLSSSNLLDFCCDNSVPINLDVSIVTSISILFSVFNSDLKSSTISSLVSPGRTISWIITQHNNHIL